MPDDRTPPTETVTRPKTYVDPTRTQLTTEQRGLVLAAVVTFLGVAFVGPALARANKRGHDAADRLADRAREARVRVRYARKRARKKLRRLGGGGIWR